VHELLQVHRRHLVELMQRYTRLKGEAPEQDLGLGLVVDAQLFRLEGTVRWLDAADARLARVASAPQAPAHADRPGSDPAPQERSSREDRDGDPRSADPGLPDRAAPEGRGIDLRGAGRTAFEVHR
jgi:hypothetical protein